MKFAEVCEYLRVQMGWTQAQLGEQKAAIRALLMSAHSPLEILERYKADVP